MRSRSADASSRPSEALRRRPKRAWPRQVLPSSQRINFDSAINQELGAIEAELETRHKVQNWASRFGESATRQKFGDALTDKSLRDFNDNAVATRTTLESIDQRMEASGLFPKRR